MSSVLFDAPGPRTRSRHTAYTVVSTLVVLAAVALALWQLGRKGQFAQALWEPFVTPRLMNVLLDGLISTLEAAAIAIAAALVFGLVFGSGKLSSHRLVRWPCWVVVEFFRAVPLLMLIIGVWYYLGAQPGTVAFWSLVLGLVLYNGSVFAEIFRAGINAVPAGQAEAAYAIGMRKGAVMRVVLIPQGVKIMLPTIISQGVVALKDTSLGYAITSPGLVYSGKLIYNEFDNVFVTAVVLAAIYICMNATLSYLANVVQRRISRGKKGPVAADVTAGDQSVAAA